MAARAHTLMFCSLGSQSPLCLMHKVGEEGEVGKLQNNEEGNFLLLYSLQNSLYENLFDETQSV